MKYAEVMTGIYWWSKVVYRW